MKLVKIVKKSDANEAKLVQNALSGAKQHLRSANKSVQNTLKRFADVNNDPNALKAALEFAALISDCRDEIKVLDTVLKNLDVKNSKLIDWGYVN